jgi:hypothetical protein
MTSNHQMTYAVDFSQGRGSKREIPPCCRLSFNKDDDRAAIPRIARLMALAIRFEGQLRDETIEDYAELARLGGVTRARITQIMKLRHLAPDIQEQILFLPNIRGLNERNLRPVVRCVDWRDQRRMFQGIGRS